jgi:AraC family transcriptional regulator
MQQPSRRKDLIAINSSTYSVNASYFLPTLEQFDQLKESGKSTAIPLNSPSIRSELEWLKRPQAGFGSSDLDLRAVLSQWIVPELASPVEFSVNGSDDAHVLTLCLTATNGEWFAGGKPFHKGHIPSDSLWIKEPLQEARAIYREGFTCFRIYLPQTLIAECYEATFGRSPSSDLVLSKSKHIGDPKLKTLVRMLVDLDKTGGPAASAFLDGASLALASRLISLDMKRAKLRPTNKEPTALAKWKLKRTIEYIEANLTRPIYLVELSNVVGLSRMHFAAQFRVATGYTPSRYILRQKIIRAQALLRDQSISIVEVASILGFKTQAHFTVAFKSVVGCPPAHWRNCAR